MKIIFEEDANFEKKYAEIMSDVAVRALELEELNHETAEVSLSLVSLDEIHQLNKGYRSVDSPTDVLSFPQYDVEELLYYSENPDEAPEELILGDVVICIEKAKAQAEEFGHSVERELIYLFTHSVLHLLGYDHMEEDEKKAMRKREEEILSEIGITR